jgi:hypothetical protein
MKDEPSEARQGAQKSVPLKRPIMKGGRKGEAARPNGEEGLALCAGVLTYRIRIQARLAFDGVLVRACPRRGGDWHSIQPVR